MISHVTCIVTKFGMGAPEQCTVQLVMWQPDSVLPGAASMPMVLKLCILTIGPGGRRCMHILSVTLSGGVGFIAI